MKLTIVGLFCFEAFQYDKLKEALQKTLQINLDDAEKTQIHKGKFIATVGGKDYSVSVKELAGATENGCPFCDDFTNRYADISVGSVGSEDGFSTVFVRSEVGEKLLENTSLTKGNEVDREALAKLSIFKKSRAKKSFAPIIDV